MKTTFELENFLKWTAKTNRKHWSDELFNSYPRGGIIALDSGTTTICLAEALLRQDTIRPLTVVTHVLNVATILMQDSAIQVIMTGGDLRAPTASLVGPGARRFYEEIQVPVAFLAATGITQDGLTTSDFAEAEIKRTMIAHAHTVYILADSRTFGYRAMVPFASLSAVSAVITDIEVPVKWVRQLAADGVAVYTDQAPTPVQSSDDFSSSMHMSNWADFPDTVDAVYKR